MDVAEYLDKDYRESEEAEEVEEVKTRQGFSKADKLKARMLFEVDGMSHKKIAEKIGANRWQLIGKWATTAGWKKGSLKQLALETALEARLKIARQIGIGETDQMAKAKELMEAEKETTIAVPTPDGGKQVEVTITEPNYKIQNEGLKRAMELTGTKIERLEHEHKHSGEIIHKYHLPEKRLV